MREETIRYVFRRVIWLGVFLLIVSFMVFCIGRFGPGDPALIRAGPKASQETIERIRHQMGFDKPLLVQYLDYMASFVRGEFGGESLIYPGKTFLDLIWERVVISTPIVLISIFISLGIGISTGLIASIKKGTWMDNFLIGSTMFVGSFHSLILVQFLILILALRLHWVPAKWSGGWESIFTNQMIIPVLTLVLLSVAGIARYVRATTLAVLDENYVRFAKAKGLPPQVVALKYVLRNALLPLITMIIPSILLSIVGSFFIEALYGIPGTGQFMVTAVFQRDYPVITTFTLVVACLGVIANLIQDVLYPFIDPRVQITKRG